MLISAFQLQSVWLRASEGESQAPLQGSRHRSAHKPDRGKVGPRKTLNSFGRPPEAKLHWLLGVVHAS